MEEKTVMFIYEIYYLKQVVTLFKREIAYQEKIKRRVPNFWRESLAELKIQTV